MYLSAHSLVCCAQTGNAVEFVKLLLDMRDKYETTIAQAFSDDKNFKNTLNSVSGLRGSSSGSSVSSPYLPVACVPQSCVGASPVSVSISTTCKGA